MCEIRDIIFSLENISKTQGIVILLLADSYIVFYVRNVFTATTPSISATRSAEGYFHATLKRRIVFDKIDYIEFDPTFEVEVMHAKEKPLGAATGVYILVQQQIIFI